MNLCKEHKENMSILDFFLDDRVPPNFLLFLPTTLVMDIGLGNILNFPWNSSRSIMSARNKFRNNTLPTPTRQRILGENLILQTARGKKDLDSKSFGEAGPEWIESVTGIDNKRRVWNTYNIDGTIFPSSSFKAQLDQISRVFHLQKEAGRRNNMKEMK
ncbi:hypothetical protein ROZALSC1DRAFT_25348 [Rozella allomycis CSF55]|uniref:Uncharacterized protein n=1 Tax=Rozella allomycis (strain CSF55) TaxID=988480 RepID=A0A4V1IZ05_ROZAC|nr:hypothetical protein ROZALSC1DRAFT_25348 [Rozella allomycis CSF55]